MYSLVDLVSQDLLQGTRDNIRLGECMDWSGSLFLDKKLLRRDLYHRRHIWQPQPREFRHPFPAPSSRQVVGQEYRPCKTDHPLFCRKKCKKILNFSSHCEKYLHMLRTGDKTSSLNSASDCFLNLINFFNSYFFRKINISFPVKR